MSTSFQFYSISPESIQKLEELDYSLTGTRRLCFHKNTNSDLHMMLIDIDKNIVFPAHSHDNSDEIVILIKGEIDYLFDEHIVRLRENGASSLIIPAAQQHKVASGPEGARFIEVIKGPF